jgi:hypothetical protein
MKAASSSETLVAVYQSARDHIPEDRNIQILTAFGIDSYMNICNGIGVTRGNSEFV